MNAQVIELPDRRMSAAEFKVSRERLGLTAAWVATQLGVRERSVSRWESGEDPVNPRAAELLRKVHAETNRYIMQRLRQSSAGKRRNTVQLQTYRLDSDIAASNVPESWKQYPASWHRAMIGRLALLLDRPVTIVYAEA